MTSTEDFSGSGLVISPLVGVRAKNQLNTPSPKCFIGNRDIVFTSIMRGEEVFDIEERILASRYSLVQVFGGNAIDEHWRRLVGACEHAGVGVMDSTIVASKAQLYLRWHARVTKFIVLSETELSGG